VLFTNHLSMVYTLFVGMLLAQIAMFLLGHFGARFFVFVLSIPAYLLRLIIIIFCLFGSYLVSNNLEGVAVMFFTGILGYFGEKIGIPPAPVVIGLILSNETEKALLESLQIGHAKGSLFHYFFSSPLCVVLIILTILSLSYAVYVEIRARKSERD